MNQQLFDRLARGITPTAAGASLLPLRGRFLTTWSMPGAVSRNALARSPHCQSRYYSHHRALCYRSFAIRDFRREYPQVAVHVVEDVTENLIRLLEVGELDVALVSTCQPSWLAGNCGHASRSACLAERASPGPSASADVARF